MTRYLLVAVLAAACGKSDGTSQTNDKPTVQAFDDYKHKSMATEGKLFINKLSKESKYVAIDKGTYPTGKAPLTPTTDCCKNPDHRCTPDPTAWTGEPWKTLEFSIDDPGRFRVSYEGAADGKSFVATAVGDLDCNGKPLTFTATGSIDASGSPVVVLTPPN